MTAELASRASAPVPMCMSQQRECLQGWGRTADACASGAAARGPGSRGAGGRSGTPGRRPAWARPPCAPWPAGARAPRRAAPAPARRARDTGSHPTAACGRHQRPAKGQRYGCQVHAGPLACSCMQLALQTVSNAATPNLGTVPLPCHAARAADKQPLLLRPHLVFVKIQRGCGLPGRLRVWQLAPLSHPGRPTSAHADVWSPLRAGKGLCTHIPLS